MLRHYASQLYTEVTSSGQPTSSGCCGDPIFKRDSNFCETYNLPVHVEDHENDAHPQVSPDFFFFYKNVPRMDFPLIVLSLVKL